MDWDQAIFVFSRKFFILSQEGVRVELRKIQCDFMVSTIVSSPGNSPRQSAIAEENAEDINNVLGKKMPRAFFSLLYIFQYIFFNFI